MPDQDVSQESDPGRKADRVKLSILAQRVHQLVFRFAVPGVSVLGEDGKQEPSQLFSRLTGSCGGKNRTMSMQTIASMQSAMKPISPFRTARCPWLLHRLWRQWMPNPLERAELRSTVAIVRKIGARDKTQALIEAGDSIGG